MWGIIKYMLNSLGMTFSAAFGNNPEGMSWKIAFVGVGTLVLLIILAYGLIYLLMLVFNIILDYKK